MVYPLIMAAESFKCNYFFIFKNMVVVMTMSLIIDKKNQDNYNSRTACAEIRKNLPYDLLPFITVLLQDSGYVTIKPRRINHPNWIRVNEKVKQMGGIWVSNGRFSHWSISYSR